MPLLRWVKGEIRSRGNECNVNDEGCDAKLQPHQTIHTSCSKHAPRHEPCLLVLVALLVSRSAVGHADAAVECDAATGGHEHEPRHGQVVRCVVRTEAQLPLEGGGHGVRNARAGVCEENCSQRAFPQPRSCRRGHLQVQGVHNAALQHACLGGGLDVRLHRAASGALVVVEGEHGWRGRG